MSNTSKSGERRSPIAVIGLSGLYPRAETLEAFHQNMSDGLDCVTPLSIDRQTYSGIPGDDHIESGHLNRVDLFDHEFFGLSKGEAEHMDPQQRLTLEQTCLAIQNAGYSLRELRGSRTAVIFAQGGFSYYMTYLYPKVTAAASFGNQPAMLTARVSYLLGLRGPSMMLDTTCSSSLMTVHEACNRLWLDEADCAIAGGVSLKTDFKDPKGNWGGEILASSRRSKTFDASADGTGIGEAVGVIVLKPLARAIEDGDHIHAVVLGSAVNSDGERSNGMTSPNADAQTEVVLRAWRNAGVRADDVGYIEVHGTGTRVGDPIEARGLTAAFATQTDRKHFCAMSSLKSSIGHAGIAAGIASLTRVILALKHKRLYPTLHFQNLNPLIDLDSSALYVNDRLRDWEAGPSPRRAGVSAFGLSGTNVHAIIEEAPPIEARPHLGGPCLVTLAARTAALLDRYLRQLLPAVQKSEADVADLAFVLCAGRDDYACREAFMVRTKQELLDGLNDALARSTTAVPVATQEVALLLPGDIEVSDSLLDVMRRMHPAFAAAMDECLSGGRMLDSPAKRVFVALHGWLRVWQALGVRSKTVFGCGVGNFVIAALRGKHSVHDAFDQAAQWQAPPGGFSREQLGGALDSLQKSMPVFLGIAGASAFVDEVRRHATKPMVVSPDASDLTAVLRSLATLYARGVDIDWDAHFRRSGRRRVELPGVPFARTRCWLIDPVVPGSVTVAAPPTAATAARAPRTAVTIASEGVTETERGLGQVWADILGVDTLSRDTEFGDIGGDSLTALDIAEQVEARLGVRLDTSDFIAHPSLSGLATRIEELRRAG